MFLWVVGCKNITLVVPKIKMMYKFNKKNTYDSFFLMSSSFKLKIHWQ